MMTKHTVNAERFLGFADTYGNARPQMPDLPVRLLAQYLCRAPQCAVDLGCGTGLSSKTLARTAKTVIGVEPSADMLAAAEAHKPDNVRFVQAFSDATGLADACADLVVCSQSFHWMEPQATLCEVNRLLVRDGIFAAVDYDWPPVMPWRVEAAYMRLLDRVAQIEAENAAVAQTFVRYPKSRHLQNIKDSGFFAYARELVFSYSEPYTKERLLALAYSHGGVQTVLRLCPSEIAAELQAYAEAVDKNCVSDTFEVTFCYRMRVGIKAAD